MPTDRQISQLVLQVDANIAVAQRSLQDLARTVNQSSSQMNRSLDSTVQAHGRLNNAFNQSRLAQMELSHVVTASVDAYAAGFSPLRIMTLEMGRLAEAATFLGGAGGGGVLGKLAGFMSGPWGIAVLLGVNVLAQLFSKMGQGTDSVEALVQKMREHAKEAANSKQADLEWANSIDGLIDRNQKLIETLQKRLSVEAASDLASLDQARKDNAKAKQDEIDAQKQVNNLRQQLANAVATPSVGIGQGASTTSVNVAVLQTQLAQAEQALASAKQAVATTNQAITESEIAVGESAGKALSSLSANAQRWSDIYRAALQTVERQNGTLASSSTQLSAAFEVLKKAMDDAGSAGEGLKSEGKSNSGIASAMKTAQDKARELGIELRDGKTSVAAYVAAMQKLAQSLQSVADAAKDAKKGTGEFGKQISFADAEAIAKGAGLTVTSGYRSFSKQQQLYDTVRSAANPVARPGTSAHEGVNGKWALDIAFAPGLTAQKLKKLYGDQGVSLSAVYKESGHFHIEGSRSQAAAADRAAQKQVVNDDSFARESAQLDAELLGLKKQLTGDYTDQARISVSELDAQKTALNDAIQKQQDAGQLTSVQAQILRTKVDELTTAKKNLTLQEFQVKALDSQQATFDQASGFQIDRLKFEDEMAKTADQHRKLQLEILDIQYREKEADLQILLAKQKLAGLADDAARTQAQINNLPAEKAYDQGRVVNGTLNPLQQYFNDIPHTADQINQAMQSIEAGGIQGLVGALSQAGKGWGAMRDAAISALQDIASKLIQLGIEKELFSLFGNAVLGGGGGGAGGVVDLTGPQFASQLGHFAGGGFVSGSGTPTSDSIPAMLSNGEYVMNAAAVRKFGVGYLDAMNSGVPHMKHGGLLGDLLPFIFGGVGAALLGGNPLLGAGIAGGLFTLGRKLGGPFGDILEFAGSPALFLGEHLLGKHGKSIPAASKIKLPQAANSNTVVNQGDTHIHVVAPNTGDPVKDRQTAVQFASALDNELAMRRRKGLAA